MSHECLLNIKKNTNYIFECPLNVSWMSRECTLNVLRMSPECHLNVTWMWMCQKFYSRKHQRENKQLGEIGGILNIFWKSFLLINLRTAMAIVVFVLLKLYCKQLVKSLFNGNIISVSIRMTVYFCSTMFLTSPKDTIENTQAP